MRHHFYNKLVKLHIIIFDNLVPEYIFEIFEISLPFENRTYLKIILATHWKIFFSFSIVKLYFKN